MVVDAVPEGGKEIHSQVLNDVSVVCGGWARTELVKGGVSGRFGAFKVSRRECEVERLKDCTGICSPPPNSEVDEVEGRQREDGVCNHVR